MLPLGTTAALTLCLVQCSAEQPGDTADEPNLGSVSQALERCGNKPCSAPADCTGSMPVCALTAGATCFNNTECTYKLNTGSGSGAGLRAEWRGEQSNLLLFCPREKLERLLHLH
jgi:hypothetical protein